MILTKRYYAALVLLFLILYILPLNVRPMIMPDEDRYGEIPREMITSGNWIVPHLNGVRYFEKPVMGYWLNGLSILLFGENAFAVRLPSAIAAGLSVLMTLMLVRRYSKNEFQPVLTGLILLTCFEAYGIGVFSVLDTIVSMFLTGAMISYFRFYSEKNKLYLVTFGIFCGLAFLTKGFLAFAVPIVAIVPFMIWEKQWKELLQTAWIPIIIAVLVSLPWGLAIHFKESDFWHYFFWIEHIKRFAADDAQHVSPFWYFIPVILGGAMPWTFLFPAALSGIQSAFRQALIKYSMCWFMFPFLFFSISKGKLMTYILPCFPPLAILLAFGLTTYSDKSRNKAFDIGAKALIGLVTLIAVALLIHQITGFPVGIKAYEASEHWKWITGLIAISLWAGGIVFALKQTDHYKKLIFYGIAPAVLMLSAHFIIPDHTLIRKAPGEFLLSHADKIKPDTILVSGEDPVRSVCWFYKRDDVYMLEELGELTYGFGYADAKHRRLTIQQFKQMIVENTGKNRIIYVATKSEYKRFAPALPKPVYEKSNGGIVFAMY